MIEKLLKSVIGDERIAQFKFERRFLADQRENRPVLFVHQMGKVGSTSIVKSLKSDDAAVPWRIYQTHFLSAEGTALVEDLEIKAYDGWSNLPRRAKHFLVSSREISRHIAEGDFSRRDCKVISLVRDPVSTNLSGFFHNHHWWPNDLAARCRTGAEGWENDLLDHFLDNYPHYVPEDWFDLEMKAVFGVDVFASEFDKELGYQVYESQTFPLLLLRLENMSESVAEVICDFLDLDSFVLERSNTAEDKWYADLYTRFKADVLIPSSYLDQMYATAFVRHFYTAAEIAGFRKKWEKPESIGIVTSEA